MLQLTPPPDEPEPSGSPQTPLRALFEQEESGLLRYAFSLTGRRAIAEEIVQDVFLNLHAKWGSIEHPQRWLYRSVRNGALNHLRKSGKEVLRSDESMQNDLPNPPSSLPDSQLVRMETNATLRQFISELSETDQQLIQLKYFDGLKYREIGEKTGLTTSNVGYRLHHILKQLSLRLQPLGIEGVDEL